MLGTKKDPGGGHGHGGTGESRQAENAAMNEPWSIARLTRGHGAGRGIPAPFAEQPLRMRLAARLAWLPPDP